ncbi:unnamed protein product [Caenorhabditis nigoni]
MTDQRFPFLRLPDDLRSKVFQTTEYLEIIAYSFVSKKAYSMIQSFRLPILTVRITMKKQPEIEVKLSAISIKFGLNMQENDEKMTHLNGLPVNVRVTYLNFENHEFSKKISTWTNQGKTVGEWIQHLCSISQAECYVADFLVRDIELDTPTLRKIFPKLRTVSVKFPQAEANENDITSAKHVFKAFLVDVKDVRLEQFPFQDNLSLQHIGMGNSKILQLYDPRNIRIDDLLTLNAESIFLKTSQVPLRDLNSFFKLWKKGSNPKLEKLNVMWEPTRNFIPKWKILMKGLKAKKSRAEGEVPMKFRIKNVRGALAEIRCVFFDIHLAYVQFTVSI